MWHDQRVSLRARMTESSRRDLFGAIAAAIAERGLCETRITDVADIVGVSPGHVARSFARIVLEGHAAD